MEITDHRTSGVWEYASDGFVVSRGRLHAACEPDSMKQFRIPHGDDDDECVCTTDSLV
jgi:hypothetical protein